MSERANQQTECGIEITVHPDRCMATGQCRAAAPDVFGTDDSGWVRLLEPRPAADRLDDVLDAADSCPLAAIKINVRKGSDDALGNSAARGT